MNLQGRNVLSDEAHERELLKPFLPEGFDLQLFGGGGGKSGAGKVISGIVGFAIGMCFPAAFGIAANSAAWTAAAIPAGIMGASLLSTVWSVASMKNGLDDNFHSDLDIQRFDKAQEQMSYGGNIPVVYGMRKISGNQTYHKTDATQQKLHKHVVLCEGDIQGIESVCANELLIPTGGQTKNTVFTLQNVKYKDATVALSGKVLTLSCNGTKRTIRLYNKADFENNPNLSGTLWEWQTSIAALISYINRLGDGWQAFPTATTSRYPGDMGIEYNKKEVYAGEVEFAKDFGRGNDCKLPNQKYQVKSRFGGSTWRDAGIVGIDAAPNTTGNPDKPYSYLDVRTVDLYLGRRGEFVGTRTEKYIAGYAMVNSWGSTVRLISIEEYNRQPYKNIYNPIYKERTVYVYKDYHTVSDTNCYMQTTNFTASTVIGDTSYKFYDGEPPSNYDEVGGYPGMAWLDMNFTVSSELNGNPSVSCIVKGKKVLDLRTGKVEYSTNPAWCLMDFIVSKRYGLGKWFSADDIDEDSWIKAADYCDEIITFHNADGSEEKAKRYELNMVIDSKRSAMDWLQEILANFAGYLVYSEGKIKLKIERQERVSYKFNDSNCFNLSVAPLHLSATPNKYTVKFVDPLNNWNSVSALCEDLADQKIRQKIVNKDVSLEGVTSQHQALRLARFYRDYNLVCPLNISFSTGQQAMHLEPGDVVMIDYHGVFKDLPVRITEIQETEKGEYQISGRQYNDTIYTDELGGGIHWYSYATEETALTGEVPPPVNLVVAESGYEGDSGIWVNNVTARWDNPSYNFIDYYEISYSYDGANYISAGSTKETRFVIPNTLSKGKLFIKVVLVNKANRRSAPAQASVDLLGKNVPPEPITEFVVGQYNSEMDFVLGGKIPSAADFDKIELRLDGPDWSKATPVCFFTDFPYRLRNVDIAKGKHIFRVKSIDTQGNKSAEDTTFILDVRNSNTFKNIVLERDDILTKEYELSGFEVADNGSIIDPWNVTFEDVWDRTFDQWWMKRMDRSYSDDTNKAYDMYGLNFSDIWTDTFDEDCVYDSFFDGKDEVLGILSSVIDTGHIGLTGLNYIFNLSASIIEATFEDIWDKTFDDYWVDNISEIHSESKYNIYLRFSKDKKTWTEWQPYLSATYDFRYVQYKIEFSGVTDGTKVEISNLQQYYDVPDMVFTLTEETNGGTYHVNFDNEFYEVPKQISCTIIGEPAHVVIKNVTTKGLDVLTYNDANNPITARFSLTVRGW